MTQEAQPGNTPSKKVNEVDWVSATDVGTFAYCGRLFWLTKVNGKKVDKQAEARLAAGHELHNSHGVKVEKGQLARKRMLDAMVWSAMGLLIMWWATKLGVSGMSPWIDAGLVVSVIGMMEALSYAIRGRWLFRDAKLPQEAMVVEADTNSKKGRILRDPKSGLYGRPDYILEEEGKLVPVELKPTKDSKRLYNSDEMQLVHYLTLLEGLNPQKIAGFGRVVYGHAVFKVELTPEKRAELAELIDKIRTARLGTPVNRTHNIAGRCGGCAVKEQCDQALKPRPPRVKRSPRPAEGTEPAVS